MLGLLLLGGCASREGDAESEAPLLLIDSFEVWHNLMPGGKPALFFTSVARVEKKSGTYSDSVAVEKVSLELNGAVKAEFKATVTDITADYPDSIKGNWNIYRISSLQGYDAFNGDVYENYTALITLSGAFGRITVKRTGIRIEKVY